MIDFTGRIRCVVVGPLPQNIFLLYPVQQLATQQIIHLNREKYPLNLLTHSTVALRKNCLAYLCRHPHHYDVSIHVQYFIQLNNNEGLWLRWGQCLQHKHNKRFCANEE